MAAYTNTTMIADTTDVAGYMGANVSAAFTATMQDLQGVYTEAYLINMIKFDAVTNWGTMNAIYKLLLSEHVARSIAIAAIMYDPSGYTDGIEAENMVKVHWQRMLDIEALLKLADIQDFQGV